MTSVVLTNLGDFFDFRPSEAKIAVGVSTRTLCPLCETTLQGKVANSSTRALTLFTLASVAAAAIGSTEIEDVTFTYVDGATVVCDDVTSTSSVRPNSTAFFVGAFPRPLPEIKYQFAQWEEVSIDADAVILPPPAGAGSIQVKANCGWTAVSDAPWLSIVAGASGHADGTVGYAVAQNTQLAARIGHIAVAGLTFKVTQRGTAGAIGAAPPFGNVDTPVDGATGVTGSIGLTGWAVGEAGVTGVRVFRRPVPPEPPDAEVFIGNAVFVRGARPDVAATYAVYPNSDMAGWGYLMLTNMLPNGGDGTYSFSIYADDANGSTRLLGARTITCSNSTAVTPFGAIDTPAQGQTVNGLVTNFGWVLSRGPRRADPPAGGTVNVVIDGVVAGSPAGWTGRSDIAALFPAATYPGIGTALGVFSFSSTGLANGVHTIAWGVTDSQGGAAGIGSRYFTVSNGAAVTGPAATGVAQMALPALFQAVGPLEGRRGYHLDAPFRQYRPDATGVVTVQSEELDRVELRLDAIAGALKQGGTYVSLPAGTRIDPETGVFTWQLGVGFVGAYEFLFDTVPGQRHVRVIVNPKGSNRVGPQILIDRPALNQVVGRTFSVAGWAADLDAADGTGIDTIHVWAYPRGGATPIFLGAATLGGRRPDVRELYGEQFAPSAYELTVGSLPPGGYELAVFAWSTTTGTFLPARTMSIVVK